MTPEYVSLSLRAGMLSGAVDDFLGGTAFITFTRFHNWDLTPQMIVELQSAAMSMGVPEWLIAAVDARIATLLSLPHFVELALRMQEENDQRTQGARQHARPN
jgi:hypothetical protein